MRTLLVSIVSGAKGRILGVLLVSALVSILSIIQPSLMQKLIDEALLKGDIDAFWVWFTLMIGIGFVSILISSLNRIAYTAVSMKILFSFRERVFQDLFAHPKHFFIRYPSGDLLSRVQGDVNELQQFATDSLFALFSAAIGLLGIIYVIHGYSLGLTFAVLLLLPFEFLLLKPLYTPMEKSVRQMRENSSALGQTILEMIRHAGLLQNFGAVSFASHKLHTLHEKQKILTIHNLKFQIVFSQLPALVSLIGRGSILIYGGMLVMQHRMSLGELIAFLTYFGMILGPVQTLLGVLNSYPKAKVSFQRLEEIVPHNKAMPSESAVSSAALEVSSLSYSYPNSTHTLIHDLDLSLGFGKSIAIFGRNGTGKSTLADLLCGLELADSGSIVIDTQPLAPTGHNGCNIAKLEQHPAILRESLRDNLLLDRITTDEVLWELLEKVGLKSWAATLQDGLDTILGESGMSISGGQRQRIALARLVLLQPKIAIFDEFTSSLDAQSVHHFYALVKTLFPSSALIFISHDRDIAQYVDRVYEMENGNLHRMEL